VTPLAAPLVARLSRVPARARKGRVAGWGTSGRRWDTDAVEALSRAQKAAQLPGELVKWNVFRHTFASLLVQAGVSIYKVALWMGNSPDVCQRHYAALSPEHDADIDRL